MTYDDFMEFKFDNMIKYADWSDSGKQLKSIVFEEKPEYVPIVCSEQFDTIVKTSDWKAANDLFKR